MTAEPRRRASSEWRWQEVQLVAGVDGEDSRHRGRNGMGRGTYRQAAWQTDANFHRGVFTELTLGAGTDQRWISGLRIDRASARDERQSIGGMMATGPIPAPGRRANGSAAGSCAMSRTLPTA